MVGVGVHFGRSRTAECRIDGRKLQSFLALLCYGKLEQVRSTGLGKNRCNGEPGERSLYFGFQRIDIWELCYYSRQPEFGPNECGVLPCRISFRHRGHANTHIRKLKPSGPIERECLQRSIFLFASWDERKYFSWNCWISQRLEATRVSHPSHRFNGDRKLTNLANALDFCWDCGLYFDRSCSRIGLMLRGIEVFRPRNRSSSPRDDAPTRVVRLVRCIEGFAAFRGARVDTFPRFAQLATRPSPC
jgi:hypothetical protein